MNTLCKIRDVYRSIIEFEGRFEKMYEISLNEGMLLCSLKTSGKLSSGEIAELLGLTCSNTSKILRSAEDKKLIRRVLGSKDKRQMYFTLTAKGEEKLASADCEKVGIPESLLPIIGNEEGS